MASAAQWERRIISQRTKEALAVKRAQGVVLGRRPYPLDPLAYRVRTMRADGMTLRQIADTLNVERVPTLGRATQWSTSTVDRLLRRRALKGAA
jgi:DNA invertase Pin-like site-specific DNA recombinase